jgi:hypothetical protein
MLTEEAVRALKVVELKAELAKHGLVQTGKKDELIDRLIEFLAQQPAGSAAPPKPATAAGAPAPAGPAQQKPAGPGAAPAVPSPAVHTRPAMEDEEARRRARAERFGLEPAAVRHGGSIPPPRAPAAPETMKASRTLQEDPSLNSPEARQRRIERFGAVQPEGRRAAEAQTEAEAARQRRLKRFGA